MTGFPMSSIGGVWIFSGIAHYFVFPCLCQHLFKANPVSRSSKPTVGDRSLFH